MRDRDGQQTPEQQRRGVRGDLAQGARVLPIVILEGGTRRMAMSRGGDALGGIDVGLRNDCVQRNRQQDHAQ